MNLFPLTLSQIKARKLRESSSKFKVQRELNMENIRNHNNLVESRMIQNELSKFKLNMRKLSSKSSVVSQKYEDSLDSCDDDESEESKLLQALRDTEDATFAYKNATNDIVIEKQSDTQMKAQVRELSYEEGSAFSDSTATISEGSQERSEFIKVSTLPRSGAQEEYQEYYDIVEDFSRFNADDEHSGREREVYDDCDFVCCNDADCEFGARSFDLQSFYSMPNLNDGDIESLMKITKFQSMMTVETTTTTTIVKDCACCSTLELAGQGDDKKIQLLTRSIEEAESEKMLIVRRMEIEERNYQELVIMSNASTRNISDPQAFECEKIIQSLFVGEQEPPENVEDKKLLRSCFRDWLQKTTVEKILRTNAFSNDDRVKKINNFLNKIRLEQNRVGVQKAKKEPQKRSTSKMSNKSSGKAAKKDYEHKLKMQQDIIELQKLKIQRQERLITEMKLAKFSEMLKESKNDLKMELIAAKRGNTKLRSKARCIELAANIKPDPEEEEKRKLLAQGLMMPRFLQKMQERALERVARHEGARDRRLRLEVEKEESKTAAEEAKRLEDEEAKRKRLLEMREKRKLEKMAKQLREEERQRYLDNLKLAREFYARRLMQRVGFRVFELLIRLKRTNHKKSMIHRRKICMKKCFNIWHINAKAVWDHKRAQADRSYELSIMRGCVSTWKHVHRIHKSKFLVAIDWYEVKVAQKLLISWIQFTQQSKFIEASKMRAAEAHYNW